MNYKIHFRAAFLVVLCLLLMPFVFASMAGYSNIANLIPTNTTRVNDIIIINNSQYLSGNCTLDGYYDLRITELISGIEYNKSYQFLNSSYYPSNNYNTNNYTLLIINNSVNTLKLYCDNSGASNVNTSVFDVIEPFELGAPGSWVYWNNNTRPFALQNRAGFFGQNVLARDSIYNPNLKRLINNTAPFKITAMFYLNSSIISNTTPAMGLIITNSTSVSESVSDIGIYLIRGMNLSYDCSYKAELFRNSTIQYVDDKWSKAEIAVYSNWTELYWDDVLINNCSTYDNSTGYGNITAVRISSGATNGNDASSNSDKFLDAVFISNYTYELYNTFNTLTAANYSVLSINFYDETTNVLLNGTTVALNLVGVTNNSNYTTSTGSIEIDNIVNGVYTIRYYATGYNARFLSFNLSGSATVIKAYLMNTSDTSYDIVSFSVVDTGSNPVYNAYISIFKYNYITANYDLITTLSTGILGQVSESIILGTEFYKFYIYYPYGTLRDVLGPSIINYGTTTLSLPAIDISNALNFNIDSVTGISYDHYILNNNSCYFEIFSIPNNIDSIRHEIVRDYRGNQIFESSNITTPVIVGSSHLYNFTVVNDTTSICKLIAVFGSEEYTISIIEHNNPPARPFGSMGLFLLMILTVVVIFTGYFSLQMAVILAPLPLLLFAVIGIVNVGVPICIVIELAAVIVAFLVKN